MRIPIVNEQDKIIGYKDRKDRDLKDITRITGLWLWNERSEVLLAQRALNKTPNPEIFLPSLRDSASHFFNL